MDRKRIRKSNEEKECLFVCLFVFLFNALSNGTDKTTADIISNDFTNIYFFF